MPENYEIPQENSIGVIDVEQEKKDLIVIDPEIAANYKEWAKQTIEKILHKVKPAYVLVTESSAVPIGYLLREAWKVADPQNCPPFYRIAVRGKKTFPTRESYFAIPEIFEQYLDKRKIDLDKPILVFDETWSNGAGAKGSRKKDEEGIDPRQLIRDGDRIEGLGAQGGTLEYITNLLKALNAQEVWTVGNSPDKYRAILMNEMPEDQRNKYGHVMPTKKKDPYKGIPLTDSELKRRNSELVGAIEHDPILRKKALDFIHDLKIIGSEAGHESLEGDDE